MHLTTERLDLRPLTAHDLGAIEGLYADPEVARFIGGARLTPENVRLLAAAAQGKGYAAEASRAWIAHAREARLADHLIATIHPGNDASIGLATKLGFAFDRHDVMPSGTPTLIYRLDF